MSGNVTALRPKERVRLDAEPIAAIYRNLGTSSAEQVVSRALGELALTLAGLVEQVRRRDLGDLGRGLRRLQRMADHLGMISLGLIVSARLRTEELADGILNLISWPMLLLSGIWFSMEGTSPAAQALSQVFPVTHMVAAARRIMIDGAGVLEVLPEVGLLAALALALLAVAAWLFRWE